MNVECSVAIMNRRYLLLLTILSCTVIVFVGLNNFKECDQIKHVVQTTTPEIVFFVDKIKTITAAINNRRKELERDLKGFKFPDGKFLSDYVPELGGTPLRVIVMTGFRSGSTFIGELISSLPGNFFYYEPIIRFGNEKKIRSPPTSIEAIEDIKNLLNCNYYNLDKYIAQGKYFNNPLWYNKPLWSYCQKFEEYCFNSTFLTRFCGLYPFQTLKIVRMSLELIEEFLANEKWNVKVISFIRDPRGTYHSRRFHKNWCTDECVNVSVICSDLERDYDTGKLFESKYPKNFMSLRYEDLSLKPTKGARKIFNFLGLYMHPNVIKFINTHTRNLSGDAFGTYRDSRKAPFHWKNEMSYDEVKRIEGKCGRAMHLWGYAKVQKASELRSMNPLVDIKL